MRRGFFNGVFMPGVAVNDHSRFILKSAILQRMNEMLTKRGLFNVRAVYVTDDMEKVKIHHIDSDSYGVVEIDLILKLEPLVF